MYERVSTPWKRGPVPGIVMLLSGEYWIKDLVFDSYATAHGEKKLDQGLRKLFYAGARPQRKKPVARTGH